MSNAAREAPHIDHNMVGWNRAWGELAKAHGDPDAADEQGERWEYMGTYDGRHTFRHRNVGSFSTSVADGDREASPSEGKVVRESATDKPAWKLSRDELTARSRQNEVEIAKLRVYAEANRAAGFHDRVHATVRQIAHKTARNVVYRQCLDAMDRQGKTARREAAEASNDEHLALKRKKSAAHIAARTVAQDKDAARQAEALKAKADRVAINAAAQIKIATLQAETQATVAARQTEAVKARADRLNAHHARHTTVTSTIVELLKARMPRDEFLAVVAEANARVKAQETSTND